MCVVLWFSNFLFSGGIGGFVIGLGQISFFFSLHSQTNVVFANKTKGR